jgi:hypothetical protein
MAEAPTIVFVDALALDYLNVYGEELGFLQGLPGRTRIRPGLGFSINIKAELLGGLTPDELGFFCKWSYRPDPSFRLPRWMKLLGGMFDGSQVGSRLAHRLLSRAIGLDLFTIPFDEIELFEPVRVPEAYEEGFPLPTILSRGGFTRVTNSGRGNASDEATAATAVEFIHARKTEPLYIALIEPDAVGHRQGPGSPAMRRKLAEIDAHLERIWTAHRRAGRGPFLVFSDHGMAEVVQKPVWDPRGHLGPPGRGRYACFSDSTMLRFWFFDPSIEVDARSMLAQVNWGRALMEEERSEHGIADRGHGDLVFLANEGVIPTPSHVGGKHPRAVGMHGYHPDAGTQQALAAWWLPEGGEELVAPPEGRIRAVELPILWEHLLAGSAWRDG